MKFALVCFLSSLVGSLVLAGPITSGGGKGVACSESGVTTVELLDLWEARTLYQREVSPSATSVRDQIDGALDRLKYAISSEGICVSQGGNSRFCGAPALKSILHFSAERFLLPNLSQIHHLRGARLRLTEDSYEVAVPKSCEIVQLVRYTDTNRGGDVLVDQDLVDRMDATNQAALYVHEAFYAELRRQGEPSSLRVRRAVGLAMSGYEFFDPHAFLAKTSYRCSNGRSQVNLLQAKPTEGETTWWIVLLTQIEGRPLIGYDEMQDSVGLRRGTTPFESENVSSLDIFGRSVGYDYNTHVRLARDSQGKPIAVVQLLSAPDQTSASKEETLPCESVTSPVLSPRPPASEAKSESSGPPLR